LLPGRIGWLSRGSAMLALGAIGHIGVSSRSVPD
jgi:hypothetical protein